jgi:gluconolactonase
MEDNTIYRYDPKAAQLSIFHNSAYDASSSRISASTPRPNGLTFDPQGELVVAQEGAHSVVRLGKDGSTSVVVDSYDGKPLNGPHGLVYRSDGTLYFTDPRSGLPKWFNPPQPSLPYSGVYSLNKGKLQLLSKNLPYPFGIALSPDEKYLYVVEHLRKRVMRYEANADGTVADGKIFFDLASLPGKEHPCGLAVDQQGNLYVAGPGGVSIISPDGKRLGTILTPDKPREPAWGDADNKSLYLSTPDGLYRVRSGIAGVKAAGTQP